jgi:hypothetical protein
MGGGKRDIRYQTPGREAIFERFQVQTGVRLESDLAADHAGSSALGKQEAVPVPMKITVGHRRSRKF